MLIPRKGSGQPSAASASGSGQPSAAALSLAELKKAERIVERKRQFNKNSPMTVHEGLRPTRLEEPRIQECGLLHTKYTGHCGTVVAVVTAVAMATMGTVVTGTTVDEPAVGGSQPCAACEQF